MHRRTRPTAPRRHPAVRVLRRPQRLLRRHAMTWHETADAFKTLRESIRYDVLTDNGWVIERIGGPDNHDPLWIMPDCPGGHGIQPTDYDLARWAWDDHTPHKCDHSTPARGGREPF